MKRGRYSHASLPAWRECARVSVGENHVCAIAESGALYCWGDNLSEGNVVSGQLKRELGALCAELRLGRCED